MRLCSWQVTTAYMADVNWQPTKIARLQGNKEQTNLEPEFNKGLEN